MKMENLFGSYRMPNLKNLFGLLDESRECDASLREHTYAIYCDFPRLKTSDNFKMKNCYNFHIFAQNIDCGYT